MDDPAVPSLAELLGGYQSSLSVARRLDAIRAQVQPPAEEVDGKPAPSACLRFSTVKEAVSVVILCTDEMTAISAAEVRDLVAALVPKRPPTMDTVSKTLRRLADAGTAEVADRGRGGRSPGYRLRTDAVLPRESAVWMDIVRAAKVQEADPSHSAKKEPCANRAQFLISFNSSKKENLMNK